MGRPKKEFIGERIAAPENMLSTTRANLTPEDKQEEKELERYIIKQVYSDGIETVKVLKVEKSRLAKYFSLAYQLKKVNGQWKTTADNAKVPKEVRELLEQNGITFRG